MAWRINRSKLNRVLGDLGLGGVGRHKTQVDYKDEEQMEAEGCD